MAQPADKLVRSAGVVTAAVALSRLTGLVREMVMARLFGAGAAYDAFLLGYRIPNLTRDLFAEGALSSAFVPIFTQQLHTGGRRAAAELSNLVATALILVVGLFCALGILFSPQLVTLLAPGYRAVPGKYELAVALTRIMFPFLLLVTLAAQAMGVLNACHSFGVPALSTTWFNIGSVGFGLGLGFTAGPRLGLGLVESMSYGVVFGGMLQLFWQLPGLYRAGFAFRPRLDWSHPGLRQLLAMMGPALIGNAAVQINVMVNTNLASSLTDASGRILNGPVSWLGYAYRFMQLPLGLFSVGLAAATLPEVSRSAAIGRLDEFRHTLARSLGLVLFLTLPSSVGLYVLGESMIAAVYQWGRFSAADTHQTALALAAYAVGLAGYGAARILGPAFYALNDARTPMLVSLAGVALNVAAAVTFIRLGHLGHAGLALSTSLVALSSAAALFWLLRERLGRLEGRALALSFIKIAAASAAMGVLCAASSRLVHARWGAGKAAQLADLALSIPLGVAAFYALCRALRVAELELAWNAFARRGPGQA